MKQFSELLPLFVLLFSFLRAIFCLTVRLFFQCQLTVLECKKYVCPKVTRFFVICFLAWRSFLSTQFNIQLKFIIKEWDLNVRNVHGRQFPNKTLIFISFSYLYTIFAESGESENWIIQSKIIYVSSRISNSEH